MVYLAELLVVTTDSLKTVRIHARNVPRTWTQALRWRRVSRISISLQESDRVACWCAVVPSCWNIKKSSPDNLRLSGSGLWARKLSWRYALFTLTPNLSNLIVTIPVLGKI